MQKKSCVFFIALDVLKEENMDDDEQEVPGNEEDDDDGPPPSKKAKKMQSSTTNNATYNERFGVGSLKRFSFIIEYTAFYFRMLLNMRSTSRNIRLISMIICGVD